MADKFNIINGPSKWDVMEMAFRGDMKSFDLDRPLPGSDDPTVSIKLMNFTPEFKWEINTKLVALGIVPTPEWKESCLIVGWGKPKGLERWSEAIRLAYSWHYREGFLVQTTHDTRTRVEDFAFPSEEVLWG